MNRGSERREGGTDKDRTNRRSYEHSSLIPWIRYQAPVILGLIPRHVPFHFTSVTPVSSGEAGPLRGGMTRVERSGTGNEGYDSYLLS